MPITRTVAKLAKAAGVTIDKAPEDSQAAYSATIEGVDLEFWHDDPMVLVNALQYAKKASDNNGPTFEQNEDGVITIYQNGEEIGDFQDLTQIEEETANAVSAASQESEEEDGEEGTGGRSVVPDKYKEAYKAAGHAGNCGDWLAVTLKDLTATKDGFDKEAMDAIADANGVGLSHLNTTKNGWQGRYRMTARNLLVKKVAASGSLVVPAGIAGRPDDSEERAPDTWRALNAPKGKEAKKAKSK